MESPVIYQENDSATGAVFLDVQSKKLRGKVLRTIPIVATQKLAPRIVLKKDAAKAAVVHSAPRIRIDDLSPRIAGSNATQPLMARFSPTAHGRIPVPAPAGVDVESINADAALDADGPYLSQVQVFSAVSTGNIIVNRAAPRMKVVQS